MAHGRNREGRHSEFDDGDDGDVIAGERQHQHSSHRRDEEPAENETYGRGQPHDHHRRSLEELLEAEDFDTLEHM